MESIQEGRGYEVNTGVMESIQEGRGYLIPYVFSKLGI